MLRVAPVGIDYVVIRTALVDRNRFINVEPVLLRNIVEIDPVKIRTVEVLVKGGLTTEVVKMGIGNSSDREGFDLIVAVQTGITEGIVRTIIGIVIALFLKAT